MKNIPFFILAIIALLMVSLYFNAKYFSMKEETITLAVSTMDVKKIHNVLDKQLEAWNNGDHEGYMEGYWKSDSLRFVTTKGVTNGWQNTLDMYKKSYNTKQKMGKLLFYKDGIYNMSEKEKVILLVGRWEVQKKDTAKGSFALLFKNINGEWKIIEDRTY